MTRKYFSVHSNNETYVARNGEMVVVKDGVLIYDPDVNSEDVLTLAQNFAKKQLFKEIPEDEALQIRARFAVNDPLSKLRAEIEEQVRSQLFAESSQRGIAMSPVVTNPTGQGPDNSAIAILAAQQAAAPAKK